MTMAHQDALIPERERQLSSAAHASALLGYFVALGHFVPPLVIYLMKKDEALWVADQAKESLNFQLNVLLAYLIALIIGLTGIGLLIAIPLAAIIAIAQLIFPIVAAVRAHDGECYRYPISVRFF